MSVRPAAWAALPMGPRGHRGARPALTSSSVVDVLSFTTCVNIAVSQGGAILPVCDGTIVGGHSRARWRQLAGRRRVARYSSASSYLDVASEFRCVLPSPMGRASPSPRGRRACRVKRTPAQRGRGRGRGAGAQAAASTSFRRRRYRRLVTACAELAGRRRGLSVAGRPFTGGGRGRVRALPRYAGGAPAMLLLPQLMERGQISDIALAWISTSAGRTRASTERRSRPARPNPHGQHWPPLPACVRYLRAPTARSCAASSTAGDFVLGNVLSSRSPRSSRARARNFGG